MAFSPPKFATVKPLKAKKLLCPHLPEEWGGRHVYEEKVLRGEHFAFFAHFCKAGTSSCNLQKLIPCEVCKNDDSRKLHYKIPLNLGKDIYILSEKQIKKVVVFSFIFNFLLSHFQVLDKDL